MQGLTKEIIWILFIAFIVGGGGLGWWIGSGYTKPELGTGVGLAAGVVASGLLYNYATTNNIAIM